MRSIFLSLLLALAVMSPALSQTVARYALVDAAGTVQNVVLWDGVAPYSPPAGWSIMPIPAGASVSPGWSYSGGAFAPSSGQ